MPILHFKSRTLSPDPWATVEVYRNLHDKDGSRRWSIRQGGLVVAHADEIYLACCDFHVSTAGRLRVRREGRKNVHAFVDGFLRNAEFFADLQKIGQFAYDPFLDDGFVLIKYRLPAGTPPTEPITYWPFVRFADVAEAWSLY